MIKRQEKVLLKKLFTNEKNDLLKNVRKGLGSIAYVEGNPLDKTEITITVTLQFFDAFAGIIIPPAALPVALQTKIPVWLFGLTDYFGGFTRSQILVSPIPAWFRNPFAVPMCGILGVNTMGIAAFAGQQYGDMIIILQEPTLQYMAYIIIHCNNVAYGTFLNSFASDLITISVLRYVVPIANVNQFLNPLVFGYQTLFGKVFTDSIDPRMYVKPADFQQQISDIPINLPIDKAILLNTYMDFDCPQFSFVLFVSKVEPLTYKK